MPRRFRAAFKFGGDCPVPGPNLADTLTFMQHHGPECLYVFSALRGYMDALLAGERRTVEASHAKAAAEAGVDVASLRLFAAFRRDDPKTRFAAI